MTNSDILKSDLLDIIFEKRNKDYGAYSLRKGYATHLMKALGAGLMLVLLCIILISNRHREKKTVPVTDKKEGIVIRAIIMPKQVLPQPEKIVVPKKQPAVKKIATVRYTTPPAIKKDNEVKQAMVATKELEGKVIAETTSAGKEADNTVVINKETGTDTGYSTGTTTVRTQPVFYAEERDPQFPGGQEGLKRFMSSNLGTPSDLEGGERKVVQIRFKVEKDGSVSTFEIVTSGGDEFDREVLRVCKKMPRWIPAIQNGIQVPVNYVLPVTFIGAEQ